MIDTRLTSTQDFLRGIFNERQLAFLDLEAEVAKITVDGEGKVVIPNYDPSLEDRATSWRDKANVIDAKEAFGALILVYDASDSYITPDGCPFMGREDAAQYNPTNETCYINFGDAKNRNSLTHRFEAQREVEAVQHELRHHLVKLEDDRHYARTGEARRDVEYLHIDLKDLSLEGCNEARQLTYLNELHSYFFGILDRQEEKDDSLASKRMYFKVANHASALWERHQDLFSHDPEVQEATMDLYHHIQGMILLKRMSEQDPSCLGEDLDLTLRATGVALATERSVSEARDKVKQIYRYAVSKLGAEKALPKFIDSYDPPYITNTPEITPELKEALGIA
jgi:hypothetical protein